VVSFCGLFHEFDALSRDAQGVVALVQALEDGNSTLVGSFLIQHLQDLFFGLAAEGVVNASPSAQFSSPDQKWF